MTRVDGVDWGQSKYFSMEEDDTTPKQSRRVQLRKRVPDSRTDRPTRRTTDRPVAVLTMPRHSIGVRSDLRITIVHLTDIKEHHVSITAHHAPRPSLIRKQRRPIQPQVNLPIRSAALTTDATDLCLAFVLCFTFPFTFHKS